MLHLFMWTNEHSTFDLTSLEYRLLGIHETDLFHTHSGDERSMEIKFQMQTCKFKKIFREGSGGI